MFSKFAEVSSKPEVLREFRPRSAGEIDGCVEKELYFDDGFESGEELLQQQELLTAGDAATSVDVSVGGVHGPAARSGGARLMGDCSEQRRHCVHAHSGYQLWHCCIAGQDGHRPFAAPLAGWSMPQRCQRRGEHRQAQGFFF